MTPGAIPYRTVASKTAGHKQLATIFLFVPSACLALSCAVSFLPITGVLESTGCLSWRFLWPALTLPITGVLESTGCLSCRFLWPALSRPFRIILETTGSLFQSMFLLTHPITYSATNVHSNCMSSFLYFVFLSSKSPYTPGSRLHNTTPCYTSVYVIIIMLLAYMRFRAGRQAAQPAC